MRCGRYEKWIALDAGGDLNGAESEKLAAHLAECPSCREFAEAMAEARSEWMALAEPEIDEAELAAVRRGVWARIAGEQRRPWFGWKWAAAGAMALATVVGVVWIGAVLRMRSPGLRPAFSGPEGRIAQGLKPGSSLAGGSARLKSCPDTNRPDVECEDHQRQVALRTPQSVGERGRLESGGMQGLKPGSSLAGGSARLKSCPDTNLTGVECDETPTGPMMRTGREVISARVALGNRMPARERLAVVTGRRGEAVGISESPASEQRSNVVAVSSDVVRIQTPDPNVVVYWVLENTGDE